MNLSKLVPAIFSFMQLWGPLSRRRAWHIFLIPQRR